MGCWTIKMLMPFWRYFFNNTDYLVLDVLASSQLMISPTSKSFGLRQTNWRHTFEFLILIETVCRVLGLTTCSAFTSQYILDAFVRIFLALRALYDYASGMLLCSLMENVLLLLILLLQLRQTTIIFIKSKMHGRS